MLRGYLCTYSIFTLSRLSCVSYPLPFLSPSPPQTLCFELTRCHFFSGDSNLVLAALCSLANSTHGLSDYTPAMAGFLTATGTKLLEEVAPLAAHQPASLSRLLSTIYSLDSSCPLRDNLLHALAAAVGGPTPSLSSVLEHHDMWRQLLARRAQKEGQGKGVKGEKTQLSSLLTEVVRVIQTTASDIETGKVDLRTLHTCVKHESDFTSLLDLVRTCAAGHVTPLTRDMFAQRKYALQAFDQTLAEVRCYVNSFCCCGVPIECDALVGMVCSLTRSYESIQLSNAGSMFSNILSSHGSSLAWLYCLRDSELFLGMWRTAGNEVIQTVRAGGKAKKENEGSKQEKEEKEEKSEAMDVDDENDLPEEPEKVVLSQDKVVNDLVPVSESCASVFLLSCRLLSSSESLSLSFCLHGLVLLSLTAHSPAHPREWGMARPHSDMFAKCRALFLSSELTHVWFVCCVRVCVCVPFLGPARQAPVARSHDLCA